MKSLAEHDMYKVILGCTFNKDKGDGPVLDIIQEGAKLLSWGVKSPLNKHVSTLSTL
jgi:hypothetical protein